MTQSQTIKSKYHLLPGPSFMQCRQNSVFSSMELPFRKSFAELWSLLLPPSRTTNPLHSSFPHPLNPKQLSTGARTLKPIRLVARFSDLTSATKIYIHRQSVSPQEVDERAPSIPNPELDSLYHRVRMSSHSWFHHKECCRK